MHPRRLLTGVLLTLGLAGCPQAKHEGGDSAEKKEEKTEKPDAEEKDEKADAEKKDEKTDVADSAPSADPEKLASEQARSLASATNKFGARLFGSLDDHTGNLVISPASIEIALLMTWAGAKEETARQMSDVLGLGELGEQAHASAGEMLRAWNNPSRKTYELAVVNKIFTEQTAPIEEPFVELTTRHYSAAYEPLSFKTQPDQSRKHINAWVEEQTNKRIEELLPDGSIDDLTRLVLTNAVYFLGEWDKRFDEKATSDGTFYVDGATGAKVPMMRQTERFAFAQHEGLQVLAMPYVGKELAMFVILPEARDGLPAVEKRLEAELEQWLNAPVETKVEVSFPRFRIEMAESIALKEQLEKLGMPIAFIDEANFEAMSNPSDAREKLKIADVYHKAFVEVNEKGTEAAAATAVVMTARGAAPKIQQFNADHPFLFAIKDTRNGTVLFLGRVTDPRGKD